MEINQNSLPKGMGKEKNINGITFVLPSIGTYQARTLQLRIAKAIGAPFVILTGGDLSDDVVFADTLSSMFTSIQSLEMIDLLKDICELTINQSQSRPTVYDLDFDFNSTSDVEIAIWVIESVFGNFLKELRENKVGDQVISLIPQEDTNKQ